MIGLDTNILLRAATNDNAAQAVAVRKLFGALSAENPGYVSIVTLIECVWTLRTSYRADRTTVANFVKSLMGAQEILVEHSGAVGRALDSANGQRRDFADALIAQLALEADCEYTLTFDRTAAQLPGMRLLEA